MSLLLRSHCYPHRPFHTDCYSLSQLIDHIVLMAFSSQAMNVSLLHRYLIVMCTLRYDLNLKLSSVLYPFALLSVVAQRRCLFFCSCFVGCLVEGGVLDHEYVSNGHMYILRRPSGFLGGYKSSGNVSAFIYLFLVLYSYI